MGELEAIFTEVHERVTSSRGLKFIESNEKDVKELERLAFKSREKVEVWLLTSPQSPLPSTVPGNDAQQDTYLLDLIQNYASLVIVATSSTQGRRPCVLFARAPLPTF